MADRLDPPPSPEDVPHEDPPPRVIHLSLLSSGEAPLDQGLGGGDRSHGFGIFLDSALDSFRHSAEGNVRASARAPAASAALLQSVARADEGNGPAAQGRPAQGTMGAIGDLPAENPTPTSADLQAASYSRRCSSRERD